MIYYTVKGVCHQNIVYLLDLYGQHGHSGAKALRADRGVISGLLCCLGVKCFWVCAAEPPSREGLLESILVAWSPDLGQAGMGLKQKQESCFSVSWEP